MELIRIHHPACEALVSTQGAQLLEWKPTGATVPVLWCADVSTFVEGRPLRGGVPLCWPWFGKQRSPAHGFARVANWRLVERKDDQQGVKLIFELKDDAWSRSLWPHAFFLQLTMWLGEKCKVQLDIECEESSTGALHTYLYTGDVAKTEVSGLGLLYVDLLSGMHSVMESRTFLIPDQAMDRIYTHPGSETYLLDRSLQRELRLSHAGHTDLVVWNPGADGAAMIADMQADDFKKMLCIETASITHLLEAPLSVTLSCKKTGL